VRRRPARQPIADRDAKQLAIGVRGSAERATERDGFAHRGLVIDPVDADRVVVDQPRRALDDHGRDLVETAGPVQADGQLLDRLEACRE